MTGYDILRRIRQMVVTRCVEIEREKTDHPELISDLRLEDADMCVILDALDDIDAGNRDRAELSSKAHGFDFVVQANEAIDVLSRMRTVQEQDGRDGPDGPVADTVDGYRLRPGEE